MNTLEMLKETFRSQLWYPNWRYNLDTSFLGNSKDDREEWFLNEVHPSNWVNGGFVWRKAPEGQEYWKEKHSEWRNLLTKIQKEEDHV